MTDLLLAVKTSAEAVAGWSGENPRLEVKARLPGRSIATLDQLAALGGRDLMRISYLRIAVETDDDGLGVSFEGRRIEAEPGLRIRIAGYDPLELRGLASQLREQLEPRRSIGPMHVDLLAAIPPMVGAIAALLFVTFNAHLVLSLSESLEALSNPPVLAAAGCWVGLSVLSSYAAVALPEFELLADGQPPRWRKVRPRLLAGLIATVAVAGSAAVLAGVGW